MGMLDFTSQAVYHAGMLFDNDIPKEIVDPREEAAVRLCVAGYLARLAPASRRSQAIALRTMAGMFGCSSPDQVAWHRLPPAALDALQAKLEAWMAPNTARRHVSALRGVLKQAWRHGLLDMDTMSRLQDMRPVKGSRLAAGRMIPHAEQVAFFQACSDDASPAGSRDAAIFGLLVGAGPRRQEVASLQLDDLDRGDWSVRLIGKGGRERRFYLRNGSQQAMQAWLAVRGLAAGPLFHPVHRSGSIQHGRGMTSQAVYLMLETRSAAAGIAPIRPHDCRRTFISTALDRGIDISTIASMAGHASVTTTQRYDRRGERAMEAAAAALSIPYSDTTPGN
jgi:site-specific recombinase XerD